MQDLNDKITGNSLTAAEWNQVPSEIQNVIESLSIALSGADLNQLGKAISAYSVVGDFYNDTGAANAYVLTPIGLRKAVSSYIDGSRFRFSPDNANTGASTANVAGLGVKDIFLDTAGTINPGAGDIDPSTEAVVEYLTNIDAFVLVNPLLTGQLVLASQAQAQAQTDNITYMSPLRVFESFQQHGLGYSAGADYQETVDADNLVKAGFYYATSTAANLPTADNYDVVVLLADAANNTSQIAYLASDATIYYVRTNVAGVWGSWVQLTPLGVGQTWQDFTGVKTFEVDYTNTSGRPIVLSIVNGLFPSQFAILVDGLPVAISGSLSSGTSGIVTSTAIIPNGSVYRVRRDGGAITFWREFR